MFSASIETLRIASTRCELLNALDIYTIEDLIYYYPNRYDIIEYKPLKLNDSFIIEGTVIDEPKVFYIRKNLTRLTFHILYQNESILVTIFNRHFLRHRIQSNTVITVIGRCDNNLNSVIASDIKLSPINEIKGIFPVYTLKQGLTNKSLQGYCLKAINKVKEHIIDEIPIDIIHKYSFMNKLDALLEIHQPSSLDKLKEATKYLKYEEFFFFQLGLGYSKKLFKDIDSGIKKVFDSKKISDYILSLPFVLTADQERVCKEILQDLTSTKRMDRLVEGDVGSGKTVVASVGMYACVLSGYQAALMAPTEILARQHLNTLVKLYDHLDIKIQLLTGHMSVKEKKNIYERLQNGDIDIIVGTHALIQDSVNFKNLGLVVADEQHRFGVNQRKKLSMKGDKVDFLTMSATPIPRTLGMILYGDKDVSYIYSKPSNRKITKTKVVQTTTMKPILKYFEGYINSGGQAYVVCPLIEQNDINNSFSATKIYQGMMNYYKNRIHIGLLHGRLDEKQKEDVMQQFINHEIDVLVCTTVIEVGVDVENANMMVIYDAHRFGLSQLHQLRGRVGRGGNQGYCFLLTSSNEKEAKERLQILENNHNGFDIASEDLKLRGPGDFLGQRQSGLPTFLLADIMKDFNIYELAKEDVALILDEIEDEKNYFLLKNVQKKIKTNDSYID